MQSLSQVSIPEYHRSMEVTWSFGGRGDMRLTPMASFIHSDICPFTLSFLSAGTMPRKMKGLSPSGDENQELGYHAVRVGREGQKTHRCCEGVCSHSQHRQGTVQTLEEGGTDVPATGTAATDYDHGVVEPTWLVSFQLL